MKVQDLINQLQAVEDKNLQIIVNLKNPEDDSGDVVCTLFEVWNNGEESADLFITLGGN
jgi:hypothetical protein